MEDHIAFAVTLLRDPGVQRVHTDDLRPRSLVEFSIEVELPRMAAQEAEAMERRLRRLRAVMQDRPDLTERSISEFARAEAEVEDPLEDKAVG